MSSNRALQFSKISLITCVLAIVISICSIFLLFYTHEQTKFVSNWLEENIQQPDIPLSFIKDHPDYAFNAHQVRISMISLTFAFVGIVASFLAFYIQYQFNTRQKTDLSAERFENQYFHFLDVYRNNVEHTSLSNVGQGKIVFHYMFYEYKALFLIITQYIDSLHLNWGDDQSNKLNKLVFSFFINGISRDIDMSVTDTDFSAELLNQIKNDLFLLQEASEFHGQNNYFDNGVTYLKDYRQKRIKYFDGHRFRLIPYFKYIFMIFDHIIESRDISENDKIKQLNYLFCEMSEHEIGLIYCYANYTDLYQQKPQYEKYLEHLYAELPAEMAHKFKFDNTKFFK